MHRVLPLSRIESFSGGRQLKELLQPMLQVRVAPLGDPRCGRCGSGAENALLAGYRSNQRSAGRPNGCSRLSGALMRRLARTRRPRTLLRRCRPRATDGEVCREWCAGAENSRARAPRVSSLAAGTGSAPGEYGSIAHSGRAECPRAMACGTRMNALYAKFIPRRWTPLRAVLAHM